MDYLIIKISFELNSVILATIFSICHLMDQQLLHTLRPRKSWCTSMLTKPNSQQLRAAMVINFNVDFMLLAGSDKTHYPPAIFKTWNLESGIWNLESGIWNLESGIWNLEYGIWNMEYGIWNLESGIWNLESGIWNLESGIWNLESGIWNLESGIWNLESGIWNLESGLAIFKT